MNILEFQELVTFITYHHLINVYYTKWNQFTKYRVILFVEEFKAHPQLIILSYTCWPKTLILRYIFSWPSFEQQNISCQSPAILFLLSHIIEYEHGCWVFFIIWQSSGLWSSAKKYWLLVFSSTFKIFLNFPHHRMWAFQEENNRFIFCEWDLW